MYSSMEIYIPDPSRVVTDHKYTSNYKDYYVVKEIRYHVYKIKYKFL